jgi:Icc-related predicted phosphoesterase
MPPANIGLDVCWSDEKVGSQAIYKFIEKNQPLLTLHGHIHESPAKSGVWKAKVGKTISVQPGQLKPDSVSYVIIDLAKMKLERFDERFAN